MKLSASQWWRAANARRLSQAAFFLFFCYLIFRAHGEPAIPDGWTLRSAVNPHVVFLADPLTWVTTSLASRTVIEKPVALLLGFVLLGLLLGRVFCGWICPLGTLIDVAGHFLRPARVELALRRQQNKLPASGNSLPPLLSHRTKYYLLVALFVAAVGGLNMAGWFDPLAILMRGMGLAVSPVLHWWTRAFGDTAESWPATAAYARPVRAWLERTFFPATPHAYSQGWLHLGLLVSVLLLSRLQRRWWCQYLCPLGAFYGLLGRVAPLQRRVRTSDCHACGVCGNMCRMQAIAPREAAATDPAECLRCLECQERCPRDSIIWRFRTPGDKQATSTQPLDVTRRGLLAALASGVIAVPLIKMIPWRRSATGALASDLAQDEFLIRPPGARAEPLFLTMCVRCGECFRVCPQNALHPVLWEAGPEGLWTPRVVPRLGYCEPSCTLCSQVCPTTALVSLTPSQRRNQIKLGIARVDRSRCLPWTDREECGVCAEMCPVAPKAIVMRRRGQGRGGSQAPPVPEVDPERCIGCGICENKCPVEGSAAIRVTRRGESRQLPRESS